MIMVVFRMLLNILEGIIFLYGFHFAFFTIVSFFKESKKEQVFNPKHRFLILIPARNEENVIPLLIKSLKEQNYPKNMYDICVIPNNCTDNTKKVSQEAGAKILDVDSVFKNKGEVLNYAYDKFLNTNFFDTYIIFDADNVVHPNFLKEMNNKLLNGYHVVQGCRDTKNIYDTWLSSSYALSYYLQNVFLYKPREKIGASANLNGTGYAIEKQVIDKLHYRASTLTEDLELNAICAINNIQIGYADKAIFFDEQVNDFNTSIKQRKRWSIGTLQILKKYLKQMYESFIKYKNIHALDNIYLAFAPYFQILMIITGSINIISSLSNIKSLIIFGIFSYILTFLLGLYLIIYYKKDIYKSIWGVFLFPVFTISGVISCFQAIFSKNLIWEEIKHTKKIDINDILSNKKE